MCFARWSRSAEHNLRRDQSMPGDAMTNAFCTLVKEKRLSIIAGVVIDAQERL